MSYRLRARHPAAAAPSTLARALGISALLGLTAVQTGCFLFAPPEVTKVGEGRRFHTGEPTYDRFFSDLHRLQVQLRRALDAERGIRVQLAAQIEAGNAISPVQLAKRVKRRVDRVRQSGVTLQLVVDHGKHGEGATATLRMVGKPVAEDLAFLFAVENAARSEVRLLARMRRQRRKLDQLRLLAEGLERNVANAFVHRSSAKRAEILRNVEDARTIVLLMMARASEVAAAARETVGKLEHAASAGLVCSAEPLEAEKQAEQERDPPRPRFSGGPAPPATGGNAGQPSPGSSPEPPPDFEP